MLLALASHATHSYITISCYVWESNPAITIGGYYREYRLHILAAAADRQCF